jgi:Ring finger domain
MQQPNHRFGNSINRSIQSCGPRRRHRCVLSGFTTISIHLLIYLIQGGSPWPSLADAAPHLSNRDFAALLQLQFDEEDRLLAAERAELAVAAQRLFDCGVCMDTLPEDTVAHIKPCGHPFCRDCVRGLIVSQIESRRFPVLCPTCTAEPGNNSESIGSMCELCWMTIFDGSDLS